ncbi:MAG: DUF6775 family putative metallopeptidase [Planctomycetota bacterium]
MSYLSIPKEMNIYRQEQSLLPDVSVVSNFIKNFAPWLKVKVKKSPVDSIKDKSLQKTAAEKFAQARILDADIFNLNDNPFPVEVQFEERLLRKESAAMSAALYSGVALSDIYRSFLPNREYSDFTKINVFFTDRLIATAEGKGGAHIRYALFNVPVIISIPGLVYGPAKSRNYYLMKNALSTGTAPSIATVYSKKAIANEFLEKDDSRLTHISCNSCAQALFFHLTGNPFCRHKSCILFNAHTQVDLLRKRKGLCKTCSNFLNEVKKAV